MGGLGETVHSLTMLEGGVEPNTDAMHTFYILCVPTNVTIKVTPGEGRTSFIVIRISLATSTQAYSSSPCVAGGGVCVGVSPLTLTPFHTNNTCCAASPATTTSVVGCAFLGSEGPFFCFFLKFKRKF